MTKAVKKTHLETRPKQDEQFAYFTMVLEDLRSKFQVYGELHQATNEKVDRLSDKVDRQIALLFEMQTVTNQKVDRLGEKVDNLADRVSGVEDRLEKVEDRLENFERKTEENFKVSIDVIMRVETELEDFKKDFFTADKSKISKSWTEKMEARIVALEQKIAGDYKLCKV